AGRVRLGAGWNADGPEFRWLIRGARVHDDIGLVTLPGPIDGRPPFPVRGGPGDFHVVEGVVTLEEGDEAGGIWIDRGVGRQGCIPIGPTPGEWRHREPRSAGPVRRSGQTRRRRGGRGGRGKPGAALDRSSPG